MLFSVVVATYDRPGSLARCLEALAQQELPDGSFEVIVVDDGSPTPLQDVVAPFRERMPCLLLRQPNAGPAAARNLGCSQARGEFLAFTDDDCAPQPDWLARLLEGHRRHPRALLGGWTENGLPKNSFSCANQALTDAVTEWWLRVESPLRYFPTNNVSLPAALFRQIGGFSAYIPLVAAEDRYLGQAWLTQGWPLERVAEARIRHYHAQTFRKFCAMHFRYGRGAHLFHLNRADGIRRRFPLEGLAFYANMLWQPFRTASEGSPLLVSALILLSQIALVLGYGYQRMQGPPAAFIPEGR